MINFSVCNCLSMIICLSIFTTVNLSRPVTYISFNLQVNTFLTREKLVSFQKHFQNSEFCDCSQILWTICSQIAWRKQNKLLSQSNFDLYRSRSEQLTHVLKLQRHVVTLLTLLGQNKINILHKECLHSVGKAGRLFPSFNLFFSKHLLASRVLMNSPPQGWHVFTHRRTTWFDADFTICHEYGLETQTNGWQIRQIVVADFVCTLLTSESKT